MKIYMQQRRFKRRTQLLNLLGNKCVKCGESDTNLLNIDHINPLQKTTPLSGKHLDKNWETIEQEAQKCQLLCKTCHKLKSKLKGDYKGGQNKILNVCCGMPIKYSRDGCRCDLCKKAKKLYRQKIISYTDQIS